MVAPIGGGDRYIHGEPEEEGVLIALEVELEPIFAGGERALEEISDAPVGIGHRLGHPNRGSADIQPVERDPDPFGRRTALGIEDVGRDRRQRRRQWGGLGLSGGLGQRYPPLMADLQIRVGDLNFSARWEPAAPLTVAAIRRLLPLDAKLIHCRWTGESTWIPFGDFRPGLDYENHTSHPAPGQLAIYPGGISECEIFFPYGGCTTASKVGQLAANHFASVEPDEGWADRLREMGRRCLWEGAQDISIREGG